MEDVIANYMRMRRRRRAARAALATYILASVVYIILSWGLVVPTMPLEWLIHAVLGFVRLM